MLASDLGFKPPLDDAAIAPALVQLKASDKGAGKTFRERIKKGLMPEILDVTEIDSDDTPPLPCSATSGGQASPIMSLAKSPGMKSPGMKSPGMKSPGMKSADLKSGGLASGLTGRQDRARGDMVFAETPLWSFEGPFQEGLVKDLDGMLRDMAERQNDKHAQNDTPSTRDTSGRSATGSYSSADSRGPSRKKQDEIWGSEQPETSTTMPQIHYVPVPTPAPCAWNGPERSQMTPVMIPVPVPVPMPMSNADASAAFGASLAAAVGPDIYNAFLSQYQQCTPAPAPAPPVPPPQPPQPPAGFVAPPGFKLVPAPGAGYPAPAPGPMRDMPSYPGSWPSINPSYMTASMNRDVPLAREDPRSTPDEHMVKRPASSTAPKPAEAKGSGKGGGKVFIGGLSPSTTVDMVRNHFSRYGRLVDVSVIRDPITKLSRGFGFVEFECGLPPKLMELEHVIDGRKCGVKRYTYEA